MPVVTRLRSTPSMERLWEAAEKQEEERLIQEVEKDKLAKKQQRQQDTLQLSRLKKQHENEKAKLLNRPTSPKKKKSTVSRDVGCWQALFHYLKYLLSFLLFSLGLFYIGVQIYNLVIGYQLVHQRLSIILTGDPGGPGVVPESFRLEERLTHRNVEVITDSLCDDIVHGWLHGQRVILVSTGVGHDSASICVTSLLSRWGSLTKEVIFMGTAGFSPAVGGILNSGSCGRAHLEAVLTSIGDVCVSQMATNWDYQTCTFPDSVNSACFAAECTRHPLHLFGQLESGFYADPALAMEVMSAMQDIELSPQPPVIQKFSEQYWLRMDEGTHQKYEPRANPRLLDYRTCGEASSDLAWQGAPFDEVARRYVAQEMQWGSSGNVTKLDVVAVSATEGIGWMGALHYYEKDLGEPKIPSVNIRAAASYVHAPVVRLSQLLEPNRSHEEVRWQYDSDWLSRNDLQVFASASYEYAVNTTSQVVLALFEARELREQSGLRGQR